MIAYRIPDMTCGGCVRSIRAAVSTVAPGATVSADVPARRVQVDGAPDPRAVTAAIAAAGFDVQPDPDATALAPNAAPAGGCGCGRA